VTAFVSAGAGFLLAVLWFDLMFDVQVLPHGRDEIPEHVLASVSAYYRRVTTAARPMNWLIATVMLATIASVGIELARRDAPPGVGWASLAVAGSAISLAIGRTVPNAVRSVYAAMLWTHRGGSRSRSAGTISPASRR
jgi:hypothetical protein